MSLIIIEELVKVYKGVNAFRASIQCSCSQRATCPLLLKIQSLSDLYYRAIYNEAVDYFEVERVLKDLKLILVEISPAHGVMCAQILSKVDEAIPIFEEAKEHFSPLFFLANRLVLQFSWLYGLVHENRLSKNNLSSDDYLEEVCSSLEFKESKIDLDEFYSLFSKIYGEIPLAILNDDELEMKKNLDKLYGEFEAHLLIKNVT